MIFLYQDLLNFISEQPSKKELSKKLFQLGHEHEINGDIFDLEITPNRGDCLSLIGLSRDLNNFYKSKDPFKIYDEEIEILESSTNIIAQSDERATLEEELARLDARWARRSDPIESTEFTDSTLDELEESLDGIDL